ncbi:MAG: DHH family phosphoesterase [Candidatus Thorarchaeota archaeon]
MNLRQLLGHAQNVLIMGHHNADPDALCAMLAFERLYMSLNPDGRATLACEDASKLAIQVATTFVPVPEIDPSVTDQFDLFVLLDTNNRYQLGPSLEHAVRNPEHTLVIDHHEPNPDIHALAKHVIVDHTKSSTCEILVTLFDELDVELTPDIAGLLLAGILFDTRRFFYGDVATLKTAVRLIDAGADYGLCLRSLIQRPDRSERIARLKAGSRLKIHLIGDWIVVTSKVGAFEASACRALLDLGADVAIVGGKPSKNVVRLSSRSTQEFHTKTGVNLGRDVMEPLGKVIGGEGGGHANAAGANGTRDRDKALRVAVDLIRAAIERGTEQENGGS